MQSVTHEIEFSNEQDTWGVHQLETATGANARGYWLLLQETNASHQQELAAKQAKPREYQT